MQEFLIVDDNFALDVGRAKRICGLIIESKMDIALQFPNRFRTDSMDEELQARIPPWSTPHL